VTTPLKARVLLADDHAVLLESLAAALDAEPDFEVVAQERDGAAALDAALRLDVHLALLDISMPGMNGIDVARHVAEHRPEVRVVFLTMHDSEDLLFRALSVGASGYVLKSAAVSDLLEASRAALRGEVFLYPRDLRTLAESYRDALARGESQPPEALSDRELEVLKLVAEGRSSTDIARILVISPRTVARHRANMLAKLGMSDRVELTRYAIRRGLVTP
jgi:DNA-binding NarL/FixJ family response regulator